MAHDFAAQRQGTVDSFALMGPGVPLRAMVAFQFVAEEMAPDWVRATAALVAAGFSVRRDEAEGVLEAVVGPIAVSVEEVWRWEKAATEVLLKWEFWPDGWEVE